MGFVDQKGQIAIPLQFSAASSFHEGLAAVCVGACGWGEKYTGKWGYVDPKGSFAINPQFDRAEDFKEGVAKVEVGKGAATKTGWVDKTGKLIWNPSN